MSKVLRKDWVWLLEHANPSNTDGVDRWTCKTTGARIHAQDIVATVVNEDGSSAPQTVARLSCEKCGPKRRMGSSSEVLKPEELFEVSETQ